MLLTLETVIFFKRWNALCRDEGSMTNLRQFYQRCSFCIGDSGKRL